MFEWVRKDISAWMLTHQNPGELPSDWVPHIRVVEEDDRNNQTVSYRTPIPDATPTKIERKKSLLRDHSEAQKQKQEGNRKEKTLIIIKPEAVQKHLVGRVMQKLEDKGYKLVGMKTIFPNRTSKKPHEPVWNVEALRGMDEHDDENEEDNNTCPGVATVWEGLNAVTTARQIMMDFAQSQGYNLDKIVHCSASVNNVQPEISFWFHGKLETQWQRVHEEMVYDSEQLFPNGNSKAEPNDLMVKSDRRIKPLRNVVIVPGVSKSGESLGVEMQTKSASPSKLLGDSTSGMNKIVFREDDIVSNA